MIVLNLLLLLVFQQEEPEEPEEPEETSMSSASSQLRMEIRRVGRQNGGSLSLNRLNGRHISLNHRLVLLQRCQLFLNN